MFLQVKCVAACEYLLAGGVVAQAVAGVGVGHHLGLGDGATGEVDAHDVIAAGWLTLQHGEIRHVQLTLQHGEIRHVQLTLQHGEIRHVQLTLQQERLDMFSSLYSMERLDMFSSLYSRRD